MPALRKVIDPDLNGEFGGLHGAGGLEATILDSGGTTQSVINDQFGNGVASITGSATTWFPVRVEVYGPLPGTQAAMLTGHHAVGCGDGLAGQED